MISPASPTERTIQGSTRVEPALIAEGSLETIVSHMVMIPTLIGIAADSNGVREVEREGFEVA